MTEAEEILQAAGLQQVATETVLSIAIQVGERINPGFRKLVLESVSYHRDEAAARAPFPRPDEAFVARQRMVQIMDELIHRIETDTLAS
jgi:hypothetical protein